MSAQVIGGLAGAAVARLVVGAPAAPAMSISGRVVVAAFVAELVVTFALAYVVLNVATSKDHPNNSFYGLAIGFTVVAGVLAVGPVSGGVFNPAVAISASAAGLLPWSAIWLYLAAGLTGGALAAAAFRVLNPSDVPVPVESPANPAAKPVDAN
jgi:aquaporin Z